MPIRIRLARHGRRNNPYYHIVAIQSSKRRDAKPLEKLGEYDPIPRLPSISDLPSSSKVFGNERGEVPKEKKVEWNVDRIKYWLGVGAQPSLTVVKLLERGGVLTVPHKWQHQWSPRTPAEPIEGNLPSRSAQPTSSSPSLSSSSSSPGNKSRTDSTVGSSEDPIPTHILPEGGAQRTAEQVQR